MKKISLLLLAIFIISAVNAQKVQINEDPAITEMMSVWTQSNTERPKIVGWRIQILSSTDRKQVEDGKGRFKGLYPNIQADWVQEKPYYKLRIGAFASKLEAMSMMVDIKDNYPGAYVVQDFNIQPREILAQHYPSN
jgi:SPOR domain